MLVKTGDVKKKNVTKINVNILNLIELEWNGMTSLLIVFLLCELLPIPKKWM